MSSVNPRLSLVLVFLASLMSAVVMGDPPAPRPGPPALAQRLAASRAQAALQPATATPEPEATEYEEEEALLWLMNSTWKSGMKTFLEAFAALMAAFSSAARSRFCVANRVAKGAYSGVLWRALAESGLSRKSLRCLKLLVDAPRLERGTLSV